ncbi:neuronal pentraxin-2-like [Dendronephthya gigantea]|uniref:neuronal pentraxin-2-like n=1 Tax=Dendronephthya gigantea TaxID=151771 RepID=UPI001068ED5C|nr:neuronal pentraxin-2-like [Dendronephthya gigantea]
MFKSSQFGYVQSPGPAEPIKQLSGCLWLKTSATSTFFSYYVEDETSPGFQFGITSSNFLFAKINGSLAKSTYDDKRIVNNYWHFICVIWDGVIGNVKFYYEGSKHPSGTLSGPITQLSPGGKFVIGAIKGQNNTTYSSSFVGYLSCINVWSIIISYESIISMASGGMNINGDYLAWRDVLGYILGNLTVVSNTTIHFPGYSLLERRSKWCNEITTSLSCGPFYARLGEGTGGEKMVWRCYCAVALTPSKYTYSYNFNGGSSSSYITKHDDLIAIH